jgi:hypothetical protein
MEMAGGQLTVALKEGSSFILGGSSLQRKTSSRYFRAGYRSELARVRPADYSVAVLHRPLQEARTSQHLRNFLDNLVNVRSPSSPDGNRSAFATFMKKDSPISSTVFAVSASIASTCMNNRSP